MSSPPTTPEHPHLELFRRGSRAFLERDFSVMEETLAPDLVWHYLGAKPLAGDYRGLAEVLDLFAYRAALTHETWSLSPLSVTATDVFVTAIWRATAQRGDVHFESELCNVYRVHDGKVAEAWSMIANIDAEARLYL